MTHPWPSLQLTCQADVCNGGALRTVMTGFPVAERDCNVSSKPRITA
jgi:hypothetical protein